MMRMWYITALLFQGKNMQITISEKLKPYAHKPGTMCLLPGSNYALQIFPALICIFDLSSVEAVNIAKLKVSVEGPVKNFTVQLDLEKGCVLVFGEGLNGYFRYKISVNTEGILVSTERSREIIVFTLENGKLQLLQKNEKQWVLKINAAYLHIESPLYDRLSLGINRAQEWSMVHKRNLLEEIFPFWLRIGECLPPNNFLPCGGTSSLLKNCEDAISKGNVNEVLNPFHELFIAGFKSLLVPRLLDDQHQGFNLPAVKSTGSPLVLLIEGVKLIRSLFATCKSDTLSILPVLPVEFHSGRFLHFKCENIAYLDLEWSKKTIRRMILFAEADGVIDLKFQKEIKSFRLTKASANTNEKMRVNQQLNLMKGETYYFDCFQK
jgi:hypothetical protein